MSGPAATRVSPADTKTRILDAAETLFVAGGFDAMSMRQITSAAGVRLAAVNYHFGSKDALIEAVLARRLDPLDAQRVAMLDAFEAALGDHLSCEHILVAMFLPAVRIYRSAAPMADRFLQFLGRSYADPSPVVRDFIVSRYSRTPGRFFQAFQRALPELSREDLGFRLNFAMGALSAVLGGGDTERLIREFTQQAADDEVMIVSRLVSLMAAALKAPLPGLDEARQFGAMATLPGITGIGGDLASSTAGAVALAAA